MQTVKSFSSVMSPGTKEAVVSYPWAPTVIPPFKVGVHGRYKVESTDPKNTRAFYVPNDRNGPAFKITEKKMGQWSRKSWEPFTQLERQRLMSHIDAAHGNVVMIGIGSGMMLYNLLIKPEVDHVYIVEREEKAMQRFMFCLGDNASAIWRKVSFVYRDVRETVLPTSIEGRDIDYLFADIWGQGDVVSAYRSMVSMHHYTKAARVSWVGQEHNFFSWCDQQDGVDITTVAKCQELWKDYVLQYMGLPMIGLDEPRFGALAIASVLFDIAMTLRRTDPANSGKSFQLGLKLIGVFG